MLRILELGKHGWTSKNLIFKKYRQNFARSSLLLTDGTRAIIAYRKGQLRKISCAILAQLN